MFSGLVVGLSFWYVLADLGCFLVRPAIKKRLSRFRLELRARFVTGSGRFCSVLADCNENQFLLIKVRQIERYSNFDCTGVRIVCTYIICAIESITFLGPWFGRGFDRVHPWRLSLTQGIVRSHCRAK